MYSKKQVDKAGRTLTSKESLQEEKEQALAILNNWRAVHASPLNTITNNLTFSNPNAIIVHRLKRFDSIIEKLERFPQMHLSKMQDLGGCRVVLDNVDQVYQSISNCKSFSTLYTLKKMITFKVLNHLDIVLITWSINLMILC